MEGLGIELKSPYRQGAEDGFLFGAYLAVLMFCSIFALHLPLLGLVADVMMLGVPFVVYKFMRRYFRAEKGRPTVSALWMLGIIMFCCGSVLAFALVLIYLQWVDPSYIDTSVNNSITVLRAAGSPDMLSLADDMETVMKQGNPLTPVSMCFTLIWASIFTGSLLSLIVAAIVRAIPLKPGPTGAE